MFETCAVQRQVIYNTIKTDGWETFLTEDYCVGKILFQVCYNFARKLTKESNTFNFGIAITVHHSSLLCLFVLSWNLKTSKQNVVIILGISLTSWFPKCPHV